ncbi:MAG: arsenate reductase (glutaredoxin) [Pseudomonadota bacterium]
MPKATIYHNPRCSKSRQTLALLEAHNVAVEVIEYLQTPLSMATLQTLSEQLNMAPRQFMRSKEAAYRERDLGSPDISDHELFEAIIAEPILLERPIVVMQDRAILGRPPENVLALIEPAKPTA